MSNKKIIVNYNGNTILPSTEVSDSEVRYNDTVIVEDGGYTATLSTKDKVCTGNIYIGDKVLNCSGTIMVDDISVTSEYIWNKYNIDYKYNLISTNYIEEDATVLLYLDSSSGYYVAVGNPSSIVCNSNGSVTLSGWQQTYSTGEDDIEYAVSESLNYSGLIFPRTDNHSTTESSGYRYIILSSSSASLNIPYRGEDKPVLPAGPDYRYGETSNYRSYVVHKETVQGALQESDILSVDINSYPDIGEQDGYWYVLQGGRVSAGDKPSTIELTKNYTGSTLTNNYNCPDNIQVIGATEGVDGNSYIATYIPKAGYMWSDGTVDKVIVTLHIKYVWNKYTRVVKGYTTKSTGSSFALLMNTTDIVCGSSFDNFTVSYNSENENYYYSAGATRTTYANYLVNGLYNTYPYFREQRYSSQEKFAVRLYQFKALQSGEDPSTDWAVWCDVSDSRLLSTTYGAGTYIGQVSSFSIKSYPEDGYAYTDYNDLSTYFYYIKTW